MTKRHSQILKWIPTFVAGILFFSVAGSLGADIQLAVNLFDEGDWVACRRECLRVLQSDAPNESAQLFAAISAIRQGDELPESLSVLAMSAQDPAVREVASYECGRMEWHAGDQASAARHLRYAFAHTKDHDLFLRAGCSLHFLLKEDAALRQEYASLIPQLRTCRSLWNWNLQKECMLSHQARQPLMSKPGQWIVRFYRSQIRPAIGSRCMLSPSCSEYFLQASKKHGLGGVPMIGDRLIREPGVVAAQKEPVVIQGKLKYADPLCDHDGWRE